MYFYQNKVISKAFKLYFGGGTITAQTHLTETKNDPSHVEFLYDSNRTNFFKTVQVNFNI